MTRWAKANQPKEHKEPTFQDRFEALMSHHKEDLARRLAESDPAEVEKTIGDLRENVSRHAEAITHLQKNLGAQLAEARKTIDFLRKCRAMQQKQNATLVARLQAIEKDATNTDDGGDRGINVEQPE